MNKREQATAKRYEVAAQRLAKGEPASDVYRALYPKSKGWKPKTVWEAASRLTRKVSARVEELQKMSAADTIISITKRKQILSDIASADPAEFLEADGAGSGVVVKFNKETPNRRAVLSLKSHVEGKAEENTEATVTELRLRDPIAAIAELNKMEGVYAPEKFEGDIRHSMIMKEPDPPPKRRNPPTRSRFGGTSRMIDDGKKEG